MCVIKICIIRDCRQKTTIMPQFISTCLKLNCNKCSLLWGSRKYRLKSPEWFFSFRHKLGSYIFWIIQVLNPVIKTQSLRQLRGFILIIWMTLPFYKQNLTKSTIFFKIHNSAPCMSPWQLQDYVLTYSLIAENNCAV